MSQEQQNNGPVPATSSQNTATSSMEQIGQWVITHMQREPDDIKPVLKKERAWIRQRRDNIKIKADQHNIAISEKAPAKSAVGLALSGGGIRSATFNLGLLQAFERYKLLWHVDYMSTVSGGGYIGSALTWFSRRPAWARG